jgi:hypothetical protein
VAGIINVVSYGFHEARVGKEHAIADGSVHAEFLEQQQKQEIDALGEWTELLGDSSVAGWLMTVVTKADLWWNRRDEVMSHYAQGSYAQALGSARGLRPVVIEYCSVFQKFYGEVPMSGEFQDSDRARVKGHLLRELLAAVGKPQS